MLKQIKLDYIVNSLRNHGLKKLLQVLLMVLSKYLILLNSLLMVANNLLKLLLLIQTVTLLQIRAKLYLMVLSTNPTSNQLLTLHQRLMVLLGSTQLSNSFNKQLKRGDRFVAFLLLVSLSQTN